METTSKFATVLKRALEMGATDIHLGENTNVAFRVNGVIVFEKEPLAFADDELRTVIGHILDEVEIKRFESGEDVDTSKSYRGLGRFRHHIFSDERGINMALRILAKELPKIEDLGLPESINELIQKPYGLILIAGPTGAGKTTTRSSLIDSINEKESKHIISLEDTVEYLHENKKSIIRLRTIGPGKHSPSYAHALSSAMREDPDVISVGDLRDVESMRVALSASLTGHLVIAEIHASNAMGALGRILGSFPDGERALVKEQLAQSLVGIIAQRLVPRREGGKVLAVEVLKNKHSIQNRIREDRIDMIPDLIRMNSESGMVTLEDYMNSLVLSGVITPETFKRYIV